MLRTNQSFLSYLEQLYNAQQRKEDIIVKSFPKGKRLLVQNENASKIMLIKDGITKCFFTEENEKEYILEFLSKGEIVGEIELIRKVPCLCSIEAMTDVTVYAISIPYFTSLLKTDIGLNNLLLEVFAERIVNTSSRASYQQLYTTEYTLAKLLELQSKQEIEISREDKAAYLGITIRSLNRALKSLGHSK
ncbi:Crp/Fnr family transcriptional regulator [Pedobacter nyackensis]|uniref:Crp/Fnr family transcriptional regulator n=1 Tax=Pedobacter nyackensis TaxID=475255 RepID=UPI0029318FE2|nr:Crp/Fnr family transcriptional regulator [Pedobacter nyackensis]